jgi:hypothetical protein
MIHYVDTVSRESCPVRAILSFDLFRAASHKAPFDEAQGCTRRFHAAQGTMIEVLHAEVHDMGQDAVRSSAQNEHPEVRAVFSLTSLKARCAAAALFWLCWARSADPSARYLKLESVNASANAVVACMHTAAGPGMQSFSQLLSRELNSKEPTARLKSLPSLPQRAYILF